MWNNAFNEDDPLNAQLADEYGIVMARPSRTDAAPRSKNGSGMEKVRGIIRRTQIS